MSLKSQLESLLFVSLKPLALKDLAALTGTKPQEVEEAVNALSGEYQSDGRGLAIVNNNQHYQLTTSADNSTLVQNFLKDETSGELSQPSLEALTIIAYRGPIAKLEIERIRGVNCSLIIRNLLLRGLIEENFDKTKNENFYQVTTDFIRFLGLSRLSDLPDYEKLRQAEAITEVLQEALDQAPVVLDN
jgi:segregation and condensation protein B